MLRPLVTAAAALLLTAGPLAAQPRLAPDRAALHAEAFADQMRTERLAEAEATRRVSEATTDAARRRAAALAVPAWYAAARSAGRAVVTVNTTDGGNDGTCGTDPADALDDCSLLEALDLANADPAADVVAFDPAVFGGGATIAPDDSPTITTLVTVDGTANGLAPGDVAIDGPDTGRAWALFVSGDGASDSVVRGLTLVSAPTGLSISGADRVTVQGSFVGTNPAGDDRGNAFAGIAVYDASDTQIGGVAAGAGNTIGFNREGIDVFSQASAPAVGTRILGNHIGTTAGGADIRNTQSGVRLFGIEGADLRGTQVGGVEPSEANTMAFNDTDLFIFDAVSTRVVGNYLGTNAAGDVLGSMEGVGIDALDGGDTVIGGTAAGAANVIGAKGTGIFLIRESSSRVEGNFIGTNAAGDNLGNVVGLFVLGLGEGVIGGTEAGAGNTVGFNAVGFQLGGSPLRVEGNHIGVNAAGDDLGNGIGILVFGAGASRRIGGTTPEDANTIGANGTGVVIGLGAEGTALLGNRIDGNDALGIDLAPEYVADGVTPNDPGDGDDGPNGYQNFPVVTGVAPGEPVAFTLDSTPATTFRVEAFAGDAPEPSGHGEGARFLGAVEVTTDDAGAASGAVPTAALGGGEWVTTTATPLAATASGFGGTSEFSEAVYLARVATAEATPAGVALAVYPNPAADLISVVLSVSEPGPVRVALVDVLGREIALLYEGHPTGEVRAEVDGRRLAPGTYVVRAEGAGGVARQPVTVVR